MNFDTSSEVFKLLVYPVLVGAGMLLMKFGEKACDRFFNREERREKKKEKEAKEKEDYINQICKFLELASLQLEKKELRDQQLTAMLEKQSEEIAGLREKLRAGRLSVIERREMLFDMRNYLEDKKIEDEWLDKQFDELDRKMLEHLKSLKA